MSKKDAAIYRRAAELIDSGGSTRACWAISAATLYEDHDARERFVSEILCGDIRSARLYPESEFGEDGCDSKKAMRSRVIALLFAAAMAESGDL